MSDPSFVPCDEMSLLDTCIQIEQTCASIYHSFARIFTDSPKIYFLWTEMAMEEVRHADEFRAAKANNCSKFRGFDIENDLLKVILDQVKSMNDSLKTKTPTLSEALLMATILEKSVEKYHLEASKQILGSELGRLLDVMVEYSHGHVETLRLAANSINMSD
jgi:rubrerythrin